jgi:hypothetical protein
MRKKRFTVKRVAAGFSTLCRIYHEHNKKENRDQALYVPTVEKPVDGELEQQLSNNCVGSGLSKFPSRISIWPDQELFI